MSQLLGPAFKMHIKDDNGWNLILGAIGGDEKPAILNIYLDNLGDICQIQIINSELLLSSVSGGTIHQSKRIDLHDPNQFDPIDIVIDIEKFVEDKRKLRNERDAKWKLGKVAVQAQLPKELKKPEAKKKQYHQRRWHRRR